MSLAPTDVNLSPISNLSINASQLDDEQPPIPHAVQSIAKHIDFESYFARMTVQPKTEPSVLWTLSDKDRLAFYSDSPESRASRLEFLTNNGKKTETLSLLSRDRFRQQWHDMNHNNCLTSVKFTNDVSVRELDNYYVGVGANNASHHLIGFARAVVQSKDKQRVFGAVILLDPTDLAQQDFIDDSLVYKALYEPLYQSLAPYESDIHKLQFYVVGGSGAAHAKHSLALCTATLHAAQTNRLQLAGCDLPTNGANLPNSIGNSQQNTHAFMTRGDLVYCKAIFI
jgi:hypothetical protein